MPRKSDYKLVNNSNVDVLNAIRNDASQEFADAIPVVTGENVREVGSLIMQDQNYTNEFIMALINRIGRTIITQKTFNNPLKRYKQGLLEMGEVVQEIFVNSVEERIYSMYDAEKNVFKVAIPDIRACYYAIDSQKVYKATINESMLAQAFLSRNGLSDLVSKIMDRMELQDEDYEFKVMQNCIKEANNKGQLYPIVLTNAPTDETTAKELVKQCRAMYSKLRYPSTEYNYTGVKTLSNPEDIMLIISSDTEAILDVDVLAKAFNMEKAEFLGHLTVIPKMPAENVYAIMCDKNWWKVWDNKITTQSICNTEGLYYNITFHHWATYHYSPFENAIVFTTNPSAITSVSITETDIDAKADTTVNIPVEVAATGSALKTVVFEATTGGEYIAEMTSDGKSCNVKIRPDAIVGQTITITAKSTYDNTKIATCTITIIS